MANRFNLHQLIHLMKLSHHNSNRWYRVLNIVFIFLLAVIGCYSSYSYSQSMSKLIPAKEANLLTSLYTLQGDMNQKSTLKQNKYNGAYYQEFHLSFTAGQLIRFTFKGDNPEMMVLRSNERIWDNEESWDNPEYLDVAIDASDDYVLQVYVSEERKSAFQVQVDEINVRNHGALYLNQTTYSFIENLAQPSSYTFVASQSGYYQFELLPKSVDAIFTLTGDNFTLHGGGRSRNSSMNRGLVTYLPAGNYGLTLSTSEKLLEITPRNIKTITEIPLNTYIYGQYNGTEINYQLVVPEQKQVMISVKPENNVGYMHSRLRVYHPKYINWQQSNIDVEFNQILPAGAYKITIDSLNYQNKPQDFSLFVHFP